MCARHVCASTCEWLCVVVAFICGNFCASVSVSLRGVASLAILYHTEMTVAGAAAAAAAPGSAPIVAASYFSVDSHLIGEGSTSVRLCTHTYMSMFMRACVL